MTSEQRIQHVSAHFVEELIRGINHDIGAPARHIAHFSQMLTEQTKGIALENKHGQWLNLIHDSGQQIQTMLTSLTQLSLLSKRAHQVSTLDLRALFDSQFTLQQSRSTTQEIPATLSTNDHWPRLVACELHWQTLFACLLENAFKFQPQDTGHLVEIIVRCETTETALCFSIEDNGLGVKESQQADLVRPFKRMHDPEHYPGLGMGLAYCNFIAELNQGSLSFATASLGGLQVIYQQPLPSPSNT